MIGGRRDGELCFLFEAEGWTTAGMLRPLFGSLFDVLTLGGIADYCYFLFR